MVKFKTLPIERQLELMNAQEALKKWMAEIRELQKSEDGNTTSRHSPEKSKANDFAREKFLGELKAFLKYKAPGQFDMKDTFTMLVAEIPVAARSSSSRYVTALKRVQKDLNLLIKDD